MSKVTLEDTATYLERRAQKAWKGIRKAIDKDLALHLEAEHRWRQQTHTSQAALVRAADAVVKAAWDKNWHTERCPALYEDRPQGCTCGADALTEALAAFHKIERGE